MTVSTEFKLNTGGVIPAVGLGRWYQFLHNSIFSLRKKIGTWRSEPGQVRQAVSFALKNGYNHIDAAL